MGVVTLSPDAEEALAILRVLTALLRRATLTAVEREIIADELEVLAGWMEDGPPAE